jgi:hypothetical protein
MKKIYWLIFKIILVSSFFLCNMIILASDSFWYFSPGFRLGWNLSKNFTFDTKFSVGLNNDDKLNKITFYNITFGFNVLAFTKNKKNQFNKYNYIQIQAGNNFIEDNFLIMGIGAGFIFNADKQNDFSTMIRLFSGFLIFPELDLIFLKSNKIYSNFGIRGIFPIPLKQVDYTGLN